MPETRTVDDTGRLDVCLNNVLEQFAEGAITQQEAFNAIVHSFVMCGFCKFVEHRESLDGLPPLE